MFGTPPATNATGSGPTHPARVPGGETFGAVPAEQRHAALARLLGHGRLATSGQVRHFLDAAEDLRLSLDWLWGRSAADGSFDAVVLVAPQAGGTGMVFLSRPRGLREVGLHAELADFACRQIPTDQVGMAQALLSLDQELERDALERAGFEKLAMLTYMQRRLPATAAPRSTAPADGEHQGRIDWPANVRLLRYTPRRRPLFLAALQASYEQTLDCPALYGRRNTDDVLRGHMATGEFDPDLWVLMLVDDEPGGIMLLNRVPSAGCVELVYLGLALPCRGHGLASRLLEHGLDLCIRRGETCVSLAVDEANHPARQLYDRFGFRRTARKLALVRHLKAPPAA